MTMKPYEQALTRALQWFVSHGIDQFNLSVLMVEQMWHHDRARGPDEVSRSGGWAWMKNRAGGNIYLRPDQAECWPVVFLDDLPRARGLSISRKYSSLIVQTSRDNVQAWVACSRSLSPAERGAVQRALARLVGADPAAAGGTQFGRAPGFRNMKPGRDAWLARVVAVTDAGLLDPSPHLVAGPGLLANVVPPASPSLGGRVLSPVVAVGTGGSGSESEREYGYCLSRFSWAQRTGRDPRSQIPFLERNLTARALSRGKRRTESACAAYARTTVAAAARQLGFL
ncbi:MAG: DNA-primase RepB domain-containing protein [Acidiferrobacterales bacterium]